MLQVLENVATSLERKEYTEGTYACQGPLILKLRTAKSDNNDEQ